MEDRPSLNGSSPRLNPTKSQTGSIAERFGAHPALPTALPDVGAIGASEDELGHPTVGLGPDPSRRCVEPENKYFDPEHRRDPILPEMFDSQARLTPEAVAVEGDSSRLTYAELKHRADLLARELIGLGVTRGVPVALCVDRSPEMLVALLAILKAGGAYLPLDPGYPPERLTYMIEDSRTPLLLTQRPLLNRLPTASARVLCLEDYGEGPEANNEREEVGLRVSSDDLAYVLYTSGSTGKPKGVAVPHRALTNLLLSMREQPGMSRSDSMLAIATICFDIATLEMFLPLIVGARVVIATRETATSAERLMAQLESSAITVLQATPATWRMLVEAGWQGGAHLKVMSGGESIDRALADALLKRSGSLWNLYGPTETTIYSTQYRVEAGTGPVPIGRPIRNTSVYILDERLRQVSVGEEGELYIGGLGLALGYIHRPDLTAERFIADPFSSDRNARMYRTGDLARWRPDGEIECLGRTDHQVKIRGFRIELGEVEAALLQQEGVRQAVVVPRDGAAGTKRLVAYLVADGDVSPSTSDLRTGLARTLPDYMIPSAFVTLPALPLTPNGKVDRKALPEPSADRPKIEREYVAPRDAVESRLVAIWEEVLGIRPIGVRDNIFDLGVYSLIAAQLFVRIEKTFGKKLPPAPLFQAPTIEQLAEHLRQRKGAGGLTSLVAIQPNGARPPVFCVPGGAGTIVLLHKLSARLGADQPFYGLQSQGLHGRVALPKTVEEMAAHYITEIRSVFPDGPYHLAGYCFGGVVALEMAHQLATIGQKVAIVILLNTPAPRLREQTEVAAAGPPRAPKHRSFATRLRTYLASFGGSDGTIRWAVMRERVAGSMMFRIRTMHMRACIALRLPPPGSLRIQAIMRANDEAEMAYRPRATTAPIALFLSEGAPDDAPRAWGKLAAGPFELERIHLEQRGVLPDNPVPRSRRMIMEEPYLSVLAERLEACLDRRSVATVLNRTPILSQ